MKAVIFLTGGLVAINAMSAVFATDVQAQQLPVHGPTDAQIEAMAKHNQQTANVERAFGFRSLRTRADVLPFAEYQKTGYIMFSDDDFYGIAKEMKKSIAQNLPNDVSLIVYTQSTNKQHQQELISTYSSVLPKERLVVLQIPRSGSNDFWSRDNTPLPVFENGQFALVDAKYYYNFEPDQFLSKIFAVNLTAHNYFYEGGNFMANSRGDCLVVNRKRNYPGGVSDTGAIPDQVFKDNYGCKRLIRFKHVKGIGHADEVVKFMSDDIVLTDTEEYVETLEQAGFDVRMLPEPEVNYETYANSLLVNDTLFLPIFGEAGDQKAIDVYKGLNMGLKIVPINTRKLATQGQGGIHCITINYPPADIHRLVEGMGAVRIH